MTQDDLLYRFRLRTFAMAAELGNVRAACRAMGDPSLDLLPGKHQLDRYGPEILRPRERRTPRMANATSPLGGAAGGRLRPRPPRVRAGPDRRRARPAHLGRDRPVDQWGVAGATPSRPVHQGQALWAGRRLCRPTERPSGRPHDRSGTSRSTIQDSSSSSIASVSAGCRAPRARSGSTPPSISPRPTPGPPCRSPAATPQPPGPAPSPAPWPRTWPPVAGSWSGS